MSGGILQWNINGFTPQFEYLQLLMNRHNPAIVCIQETNFKDDYVAPLRGYTHYNKNRENYLHASGGVTTYVKENLPQRLIPLTTNIEAIAISALLPITLCICNLYVPNSIDLELTDLTNIINQLP